MPCPAVALAQLDLRAPARDDAVEDLLADLCLLGDLRVGTRRTWPLSTEPDALLAANVIAAHGLRNKLVQLTHRPLHVHARHDTPPPAGTCMRPASRSVS